VSGAAAADTVAPVGRIGAQAVSLAQTEQIGLIQAVGVGAKLTWTEASAITRAVHQITTGAMSVKQLAGPVGITKASVQAARSGLDDLFYLIAFLSVNLAVVNLFPIPILDGGQILVNVLEAVKGSPFSMRTREYILRVGLLAIALLFVLVMYNDTRGGIARLFQWVGRLFG
jgi:regulator of sigma E protease